MDTRLKRIILLQVQESFETHTRGRKRMEPEKVLDEILYILWTGAPWRSLNAKGASHFQTVHGHFMAWARKGVFKRAYAIALRLMKRKGWRKQYYCIDTTFIKSIYGQDCVGRNPRFQ